MASFWDAIFFICMHTQLNDHLATIHGYYFKIAVLEIQSLHLG